jgi:uncharacterized protein with PIN domain
MIRAKFGEVDILIKQNDSGGLIVSSAGTEHDLRISSNASQEEIRDALEHTIGSKVFPENERKASCQHPSRRYVGEESGKNCKGQQYERERWQCPDCGASWFEGVRFLPVKK